METVMTNLSRKPADYQQIPLATLPNHHTEDAGGVWTPRHELLAWLRRRKLRELACELRLMLRAYFAVLFGGRDACNLALDAVILHEEGGA